MALTASYIAACMMAKLRVGWMVAGCAPGVRTMTRSVLFHCTTWLTGFVTWAIAGARFAAATLTRPSLRLLYSNFCEPEFNIGECRAQGIESRPVNLLACAARRGAE